MNENKLKQLFDAARNETPPATPEDFPADVLRAIRREPKAFALNPISIFDELNRLFPRIAIGATALIILCVAADYLLTSAGVPGLDEGLSQISSQWLM